MKASETTLQRIIEGTLQYVVPLFQRTYSWDTKEWSVLWDDVSELCAEENPRDHFIGSIVTMPTHSVPEGVAKFLLIDGQQRLTTIFAMLAVIRDRAAELNHGTLGPEVEQTLLRNMFKPGNETFKLLPTQGDRPAFMQMVMHNEMPDDSKLTKAYHYFARKIRAADYELEKLKRILVKNLVLVSIVLDRDDNPHLIFESLNAKGRALSQSDLIRNYFFMRVHVDQQEKLYHQLWKPMQDSLGDDLTECIRHFLMKDGAVVKQGEVYFALKQRADGQSAQEILAYLGELTRFASYYVKLLHPEQEAVQGLRERMQRLNRIEVTTAYPFLLNVYDDYATGRLSKEQFAAVLDVLENFTVRRWICNVPTYGLNKIFPPLYGQAMEHGDLGQGVREVLSAKNYPRDTDFRERLTTSKLYGPAERITKTKLILEKLEDSFGHHEPVDPEKVNIEHVMPQTMTESWKNEIGPGWKEMHDVLLHTLGNLTLTGYNSSLSNLPFPEKKAILKNSHLELNGDFESLNRWGEAEIRHRAACLAERALSIWPFFGPDSAGAEPPEVSFDIASLRKLAVDRIQAYLGIRFVKKGHALFTAEDGETNLVCLASQPQERVGQTRYWYGVTPVQKGFLEEAKYGLIAFACGAADRILLMHAGDFVPLLARMERTAGKHWHVQLFQRNGQLLLDQPKMSVRDDVSKHVIPINAATSPALVTSQGG